jgi:His-Xaa-Ser system protein HxsD
MSESHTTTVLDDGWARVELDEDLYPKDAIYGAVYTLLDRCFLQLDRAGAGRVVVRVKAKEGGAEATRASAGELENELLAQAYRRVIASRNRRSVESVTQRAIAGAAGPPGLDELLSMEIGDATAFEDPLGIAMSWEEKFAKKKGPEAAAADPAGADPAAEKKEPG